MSPVSASPDSELPARTSRTRPGQVTRAWGRGTAFRPLMERAVLHRGPEGVGTARKQRLGECGPTPLSAHSPRLFSSYLRGARAGTPGAAAGLRVGSPPRERPASLQSRPAGSRGGGPGLRCGASSGAGARGGGAGLCCGHAPLRGGGGDSAAVSSELWDRVSDSRAARPGPARAGPQKSAGRTIMAVALSE